MHIGLNNYLNHSETIYIIIVFYIGRVIIEFIGAQCAEYIKLKEAWM